MKLKFKHIIIFAAILIVLAIMLWNTDVKISRIVNGNTIELNNGVTVKLIGVSSTIQGREELEGYVGSAIILRPDNSNLFNSDELTRGMTVYAYVISDDNNQCLNALILKKGLAVLVEDTYLTDSLDAFRSYCGSARGSVTPTPTPVEPIVYRNDSIDLPDYQEPEGRKHDRWYSDGNMNIEMIKEACDFDRPYTRNFAVELAGRAQGNFNIKQICEIFDYCYDKWHYVNDPAGQEYVARASESIHNSLSGDCDDFAVLMASCVLAIGGEASIITAYRRDGGGHAYTEVCISMFSESDVLDIIRARFPQYNIASLHFSNHDGKKWLNLDWQAGYPGGPYWESSTKGTYVYTAATNSWHWNGGNSGFFGYGAEDPSSHDEVTQ